MNTIHAQVVGGHRREIQGAETVGDVRQKMGLDTSYASTLNGSSANDSVQLQDGDFVSFAKSVKGGK